MKYKKLEEDFPFREIDKEYMYFYYTRLSSDTSEELVRLYNRECDIGLTGERVQNMFLIMLHKLFINRFNKSPMIFSKDLSVELKGKIELNKIDFFYIDHKMKIIK